MKKELLAPSSRQSKLLNQLFSNVTVQQKKVNTQDKLIDHILQFDPDDTDTALKTSSLQPEFLATSNLPEIPWPAGLTPTPKPLNNVDPEAALPKADILVITWTVAEALALSDILTPNFRSKTAWYHYRHNWTAIFKPKVKGGAPSLNHAIDRLGLWFPTEIGGKKVICFKSELHFARDGSKIPVKDLYKQLISEVNPSLVITTGTAGGIGSAVQLGDVVVSKKVRFDCNRTFKNQSFAQKEFTCTKSIKFDKVADANSDFMKITTSRLPQSSRTYKIIIKTSPKYKVTDVVTTDFFAFDDSTDYFKLQALGLAVEMGDAVLGMACDELGANAPAWIAIRNASDPQIDGTLQYSQQVEMAARIYEKYGYWTTVNSAIACWAVIVS